MTNLTDSTQPHIHAASSIPPEPGGSEFPAMNKKNIVPVALFFLGLILAQGCTLDEGTQGDPTPALALQVEKEFSLVHLTWDTVNVTGFKEYIILQSTGDIPDDPTPTVTQDVVVLKRFDDRNITSFSTGNTLLSTSTCYKLYCSVGDRFMYSATVCSDQQATLLPGFLDRSHFEPGLPEAVMYDRLNSTLNTFNLETSTISGSVQESFLAFPALDMSTYQDLTFVYAIDQNNSVIRRYSYPQLELQNQIQYPEGIIGGVPQGPFLFVSVQNVQSSFQILNRNTFAKLDGKPGSTATRNIAVFDGDPVIALELTEGGITRYTINDLGKITSTSQFLGGVPQINIQVTCDANNTHYIGGRFSTLVNKEGEVITSLNLGANEFSLLSRLSADGTRAAVINQEAISFKLDIYDLTQLPSAPLLQSYDLPSANYSDIWIEDDVIHVVGTDFNTGSGRTFILKFPR